MVTRQRLRIRFWIELLLIALSGLLFVLTLVWSEWIENVFGIDPDQGNGSLEWMIVALALITTVLFGALARLEWRRHLLADG